MGIDKNLENTLKGHMFDRMKEYFDNNPLGGTMNAKLSEVVGDQYVVILNYARDECFTAAKEFQKKSEDLV